MLTIQIQLPTWVDVVKTATFKEMCPQDTDWYYIRAGAYSMLINSSCMRMRQ